ncbi:MAG: hypothetical protein NUV78_00430 [Candidatus Zambryskibacteria bacterium]|nr:hypothetical protein [Candidatus Zambryskibacteria bacterium]
MNKKSQKSKKPKDRFDEVLNAVMNLDRKTGLQYDDLKHHIGLVAEQVAGNSEQMTKLFDMVELMRYDLKLKADNVEMMALSRRLATVEKKLVNRR